MHTTSSETGAALNLKRPLESTAGSLLSSIRSMRLRYVSTVMPIRACTMAYTLLSPKKTCAKTKRNMFLVDSKEPKCSSLPGPFPPTSALRTRRHPNTGRLVLGRLGT